MIWCYDHLRECSIEEWNYWKRHPLPLGWALISEPVK